MSLENISPNLTEKHLDEIIVKAGGVRHKSWAFEGEAGKKGDYFLSEVYKVVVIGVDDKDKEIEVHLIIKTTPKSIGRKKTFRSSEFFRNEINFYEIIMKRFIEFQAANKGAMYPFKEVADCMISLIDDEHAFLALENLNPYGYESTTRQEAMNIHLARLIMQTLGRFHALSFVMRDQSPKSFEEMSQTLDETYYAARLKPWYNDFIKVQIEIALDAVAKCYGGTVIEERAKKFLAEGDLYDKMVKLTHTRNRYSVICHGDCWTPNFLFHSTKIDGHSVPVKAKMIDFQLARYSSPVLDISFFIYSCTTEEVREKHYDELIKVYHTSLSDLIKDYGSNPEYLFPFSALESELKAFFRFGVGMGIESIPFSMLDDSATPDMDNVGDEAVPITSIWKLEKLTDKDCLQRLANIFKHASDRGYLD